MTDLSEKYLVVLDWTLAIRHSVSVILNIESLSLSLVMFWNTDMADGVDKTPQVNEPDPEL